VKREDVWKKLDVHRIGFQAAANSSIEFEIGIWMHHTLQVRGLNIPSDALEGHSTVD
jgi:hypothetical protein